MKGESATDVVRGLTAALAEAAWKAALLGEGGLAGAVGTKGSGGLFGMLAKAVVGGVASAAGGAIMGGVASPYSGFSTADVASQYALYGAGRAVTAATGGRVVGPGTGTSDSIAAWLSNGEFVVNAAAANRNLPLLEAINAGGGMPRFAEGGRVSVIPAPPTRAGRRGGGSAEEAGGRSVQVNITTNIDARGAGPREVELLDARFKEFERTMPDKVAAEVRRHGSPTDYALKERGVAIGGLS